MSHVDAAVTYIAGVLSRENMFCFMHATLARQKGQDLILGINISVYALGLTQSATTMAPWRSSIVLTRFRQRWNTKMNALYHRCFTQKSRCTVLGKNTDKTHDETWCSEDRNHCVVHTTCIQLETTADWIQIESGDAYEDHTNSSRLLWCEPTCPTQTISQMRKNY